MNTNQHLPEFTPSRPCEAVAPLLPLVAQRLLEPDEAEAVQVHLSGCSSCRTRLAAYDRLDHALRWHFEQIANPPIRMEELMGRIRDKEQLDFREEEPKPAPVMHAPSAPLSSVRHSPRRVFSWVAAIAAVLVIALITTALFASHHSPGQTARPRASATPTSVPSGPSGVYFATTSFPPRATPGTLYALKAQDGLVHWQEQVPAPLEGLSVLWSVLSNGTLYMLTSDYQNNVFDGDEVYALNASDGAIRWHTAIEASAQLLQVVDGVVYTGTSAGVIFALNASDGSIRWHPKLGDGVAAVWQISNGVVYASLVKGGPIMSGILYALNIADGSVRWHAQPHGTPAYIRVVGGQVDMVAIYSWEGSYASTVNTFYALDASTGAQRWSYAGSVSESMGMAGADAHAVYLTTAQIGSSLTTLLALNAGDGSVRWQKSVTGQVAASVAPDNTMYLAFQGGVSAVNLLDGAEIWNGALSGQCFLERLVDGTLYVTAGSTLFALDSSHGLVKWRYQAPNPGVGAVVNGVLYGSSVQVDTQQQSVQRVQSTSIFALDTSSGKRLWQYDIASEITPPIVG